MRAGNSGLSSHGGKTIQHGHFVGECAAVPCRPLEVVQANADTSSFKTLARIFEKFGRLEVTAI